MSISTPSALATWTELKISISEMNSMSRCHEVQNLLCSIPGVHAVGVMGCDVLVAYNAMILSSEEILKTLCKAGYSTEVEFDPAEEIAC